MSLTNTRSQELGQTLAPSAPMLVERILSLSLANISEKRPVEKQLLDLYRWRNGALDRVFYHVEPGDEAHVVQKEHHRGSVIVVPPDSFELRFYDDAVEFLDDKQVCEKVIGISVAGVGSSPIGAAALARDVATVKKGPVAAIVSGYGVDDVVYEGLGGWFFLRETNRLEFTTEQVANLLSLVARIPPIATSIEVMDSIGSGPDLVNLKSIIRSGHLKSLQWLVGHSKGNLLISSAISELVMEGSSLASLANVKMVLLSALSALPPRIGKQYQVIGNMDLLGWVNSRINIEHKLIHGAMHHLNRNLPYHLNAQDVLSAIA
jgi:hypothetical protein